MMIDVFEAENIFYRNCHPSRIGKFLAHAKLYEMSLGLPGDFLECGVFKGASFSRFRKLGSLFHPAHARRFVGFDVFGRFPEADYELDKEELARQFTTDGDTSIGIDELRTLLTGQNLGENVELYQGDVRKTITEYFKTYPDRTISIINIDLDLYEATKVVLETVWPRVVKGGVIIIDDYSAGFPGATHATEEFLRDRKRPEQLKKFPYCNTPCYLVKETD